MSEHDEAQSNPSPSAPPGRSRRRFLAGLMTGGLLGSLVAGGVSVYAHFKPQHGWGSHAGHGFWGHHRHGNDPAAAAERAEFATDWLLRHIDASAEQRQQIQTIVQRTVADLGQVREQWQTNRQALLDLLSQPTIDRQALTELRQTGLQQIDQASQQAVTALVDVAEILTPEQRARLRDTMSRFHRM